ncbi:MAG: DUF2007 domain-containing protein [Bacteroidales bacterium]|nr:DUF2007 domain-containing protein [Bacteroidales bacterium]
MSNDKVRVYSTNQPFQAEMIKRYLADHGILSFIMNKMDSSYHFGDVEILVSRDDVVRSKKLIEDFFQHE